MKICLRIFRYNILFNELLYNVFSSKFAPTTQKNMNSETNNRYALRGVSAQKEDVHNAIKNIDKGLFLKLFVKSYQII